MTAAELRAWRKTHGMTQKQAAKWVGVSERTWIRFEAGERDVPKWLRIIVALTGGIVQRRSDYGDTSHP